MKPHRLTMTNHGMVALTMTAMDMPTPVKLSRMIQHNGRIRMAMGLIATMQNHLVGTTPTATILTCFPWTVPSVEIVMGTAMATTRAVRMEIGSLMTPLNGGMVMEMGLETTQMETTTISVL